jgi:hypothetical protein
MAKKRLSYFIKEELTYYNALVEGLTPYLRSFPQEFGVFKAHEKKVWTVIAEHSIDPQDLLAGFSNADRANKLPPVIQEQLKELRGVMVDGNSKSRFSERQKNILRVLSSPAKIPRMTRNLMANEVLKYMQNQAVVLETAMKTDVMKNAIQLLQVQSLDTKRHVQVPAKILMGVTYDHSTNRSFVKTPFCVDALEIPNVNLNEQKFKMLVIKSPHRNDVQDRWSVELKDFETYDVLLTDFDVKRKK